MTRFTLWWRLARRFMRTRPMRRSATIVLATSALLTVHSLGLESFSLSGDQIVQRDLGRFEFAADVDAPDAIAPGTSRVQRAVLAGPLAIGVPSAWARGVLVLQVAAIVAISTALGLVIGLAPVLAVRIKLTGTVIAVPWLTVALIVALFVAVAALATVLASRRLRPSERTQMAPG